MSERRSTRPAPLERASRTHHQCPGRCGRSVSNHLYACERCWRSLPAQLQQAIRANVEQPVLSPARTRAFSAAAEFYTCRARAGERAMPRR